MSYADFLATKQRRFADAGREIDPGDLHPSLFGFQRDLVTWAARKGRAAVWADTGLGKTRILLEWARVMGERTLIFAPLAVAQQTIREGAEIGVDVAYAHDQDEASDGITISNYERADRFKADQFGAVVLDESSILKNYEGKTRSALIRQWADTPARLCCTATPAPNDVTELANHAEFLGILARVEMLAAYFVHDDDGWRPKGHAVGPMYAWMSRWARAVRRPSDLGHPEEDERYDLPALTFHPHIVGVNEAPEGALFATDLGGVGGRSRVRRATLADRCDLTAGLVSSGDEPWIVWCGLNDEADRITAAVDGAVNVEGSMSADEKADRLMAFVDGDYRVLVTKPQIAGLGLNLQRCARMAFTGLSDSYESYYQAIRRCWRFGQTRPVQVHIVVSELEQQIVWNVQRKETEAAKMTAELVDAMRREMAG